MAYKFLLQGLISATFEVRGPYTLIFCPCCISLLLKLVREFSTLLQNMPPLLCIELKFFCCKLMTNRPPCKVFGNFMHYLHTDGQMCMYESHIYEFGHWFANGTSRCPKMLMASDFNLRNCLPWSFLGMACVIYKLIAKYVCMRAIYMCLTFGLQTAHLNVQKCSWWRISESEIIGHDVPFTNIWPNMYVWEPYILIRLYI